MIWGQRSQSSTHHKPRHTDSLHNRTRVCEVRRRGTPWQPLPLGKGQIAGDGNHGILRQHLYKACPPPPDPQTHTLKIDSTDTAAPCDVRRYEMGNIFLNTGHFDTRMHRQFFLKNHQIVLLSDLFKIMHARDDNSYQCSKKKRHFILDLMGVAMLRSHDQPNTNCCMHADWTTALSKNKQEIRAALKAYLKSTCCTCYSSFTNTSHTVSDCCQTVISQEQIH